MNMGKRFFLAAFIITVISGAMLYFTGDIHTLRYLKTFRPWAIVLAFLFLSLGMYFDAARLITLTKLAGAPITFFQSLQVILSNYFLALLTPGAAGGAVAQVLTLREAGLPAREAAVLVFVRTGLSLLFLFLCLPVVLYLDPLELPWLPEGLALAAATAAALAAVFFAWLVYAGSPARLALRLLCRLPQPRRRQLWKRFRDTEAFTRLLFSSPAGMGKVFTDTALSLLALYAIVPTLFLGLGVPVDWPVILGRMIVLNVLLYFAPTPGGAGIAEGGFVLLFHDFAPAGTIGLLAVAWRILAEYLPFAAGMFVTLRLLGHKLPFAGAGLGKS